jgi:glutamyl-Q tRNA(Asp) synthetase
VDGLWKSVFRVAAECAKDKSVQTVTRFAPSPNGLLHLGHAYSAIIAHDLARDAGGHFLLRIEDIDGPRSHPELADEFRLDLEWLGLEWEEVPAQSTRLESYRAAAQDLLQRGLLYPCTCTRAQIAALEPRMGADGVTYPGTCRDQSHDAGQPAALRLDVERAMQEVGEIVWTDAHAGSVIADPREFGDVVIVRKDLPASYHLAATLDDAADGVTLVTRGKDLFAATHVHRVLQELLKLPVPEWHHHALVMDESGEKLAKRRGSPPLKDRREGGEDGLMLAEQLRLRKLPLGT